jgi:hypothetical protein
MAVTHWAVGILVGITSLAETPFFHKRGAGCTKTGDGAPFFPQKGGQCPLFREKGVPTKKMIPKCTDRDFLWHWYGKYQEIPTDTDRKIPIQYTTLECWYHNAQIPITSNRYASMRIGISTHTGIFGSITRTVLRLCFCEYG